MKIEKNENNYYSSNKERINIDNRKYVEALRRNAMEEKKKHSPILFESEWPSFPDYQSADLKRHAYKLIEALDLVEAGFKGVSVSLEKTGNIVDPLFIVHLNKEYRGETALIEEMFPQNISTKGGYKKINVQYVIFN